MIKYPITWKIDFLSPEWSRFNAGQKRKEMRHDRGGNLKFDSRGFAVEVVYRRVTDGIPVLPVYLSTARSVHLG